MILYGIVLRASIKWTLTEYEYTKITTFIGICLYGHVKILPNFQTLKQNSNKNDGFKNNSNYNAWRLHYLCGHLAGVIRQE